MGTRYTRSWVLSHVRAFLFAIGSLVGTSTSSIFLTRYACSWVLPHIRALSVAFGSLVGTSTRSSFLTRYARSWVLLHVRAFSLATLARRYFHSFELSRSPLAHLWALPHV